ncbi:MAG: PepSY domain-containing protein [Candidatus Rokuibacteriota bacterium]
MKRMLSVVMAVAVIALLGGAAFAQMGGPGGQGMGPGMMGPGTMGPGMMGRGMAGRGMMHGASGQQDPAVQVTEEKAQELAQEYANEHLKGFTVERVLPFTGMHGTMYSVELKGPEGQVRTFHINPWGNVMPFGGPQRRAG